MKTGAVKAAFFSTESPKFCLSPLHSVGFGYNSGQEMFTATTFNARMSVLQKSTHLRHLRLRARMTETVLSTFAARFCQNYVQQNCI